MRFALFSIAVLSACGGDDHQQHHSVLVDGSTPPDASHDAAAQTGPHQIKLDFFGTPDLIVYRDGTGPWLVPTAVTGGYELHVTEDYQVVAACSVPSIAGNEDSEQLNATAEDGAAQFMFCGGGSSSAPTTFAVTGQMLQPGSVQMSDTATGTTSPWSFSLDVSAGTHDLFAIGATNMLIRRDLALNAATAIADVDVATDGTPYANVAATVVGAGQTESVEIQSELFSANGYATLSDTADRTIKYAPAALLVASDEAQVNVRVLDTAMTVERQVYAFNASPTTFTLMPVLTGVTFGTAAPVAATWGTLPAYTMLEMFTLGGIEASFYEQNVIATQQWIAKTGATSLAFENGATGYNPAWNVPTAGAFAQFTVTSQALNMSSTTSVMKNGTSGLRAHVKTRRPRRP